MNRAERRRLEREEKEKNRRTSKMQVSGRKITMSLDDLQWMKAEMKKEAEREVPEDVRDEIYKEAVAYNSEFMNWCFAMALHKCFGFGSKRITRVLSETDTIFGEIAEYGVDRFEEIKKQLEDEANFVVDMGEE